MKTSQKLEDQYVHGFSRRQGVAWLHSKGLRQATIARRIGLSRERVRQMLNKARREWAYMLFPCTPYTYPQKFSNAIYCLKEIASK